MNQVAPRAATSTELRVGEVIEAGAPRGSFVLRAGDRPVVLIGAGVGATPVLAMLHVLAAERSARQVWWLHGARSSAEHSFAHETCALLEQLPHAHRIVCYSHPGTDDRGFDLVGRLTAAVLDQGTDQGLHGRDRPPEPRS
jgi:ferredoxin-NADP reductase